MALKIALGKFLSAFAFTGLCAGALAQEITLKIHHFVPPRSNPHTRFIQPWADKVSKQSGGRIKFQIYPSMQLGGSPPQLYDQARDGVADIVFTLPGMTAGRFPCVEVFELPFIMTTAEATSKAAWDYVATMAPDEFKETKLLSIFVHTPGRIFLATRPINSLADFKGLKLRAPTRQTTKLLAALGATPVGMPVTQIPEALSKGVINGAIVPYEIVPTLKIHELTKFVTETDSTFPGLYTTVFVLTMNKTRYQSLPADLKKIIDANSGRDLGAWIATQTWTEADKAAKQIVQKHGNAINVVASSELERWKKATDSLDDDWVRSVTAKGFDGNKLLESARSLIAKHSK